MPTITPDSLAAQRIATARLERAIHLAEVISEACITADQAEWAIDAPGPFWREACRDVERRTGEKFNLPSEETKRLTVALLRAIEKYGKRAA